MMCIIAKNLKTTRYVFQCGFHICTEWMVCTEYFPQIQRVINKRMEKFQKKNFLLKLKVFLWVALQDKLQMGVNLNEKKKKQKGGKKIVFVVVLHHPKITVILGFFGEISVIAK